MPSSSPPLPDSWQVLSYHPQPSFPEFTLFYNVFAMLVLQPSALSSFPLLSKWYHDRMSNRKGIKEYLESGRKPAQLNYLKTAEGKICD